MPSRSFNPVCAQCGQRAPIVIRGLTTTCVACGAPRLPLGASNVSLAGRPARLGGITATIAGLGVLFIGLSVALALGLLLHAIWPASLVGLAVAIPIAVASLFFGILLLFGGRRLLQSGVRRKREVELEAVRALVAHRGGMLTAEEAARALDVLESEADELLMILAKESDSDVSLEVDDAGQLRYEFGAEERRFRVLEDSLRETREVDGEPVEPARGQRRIR